MSQTTYTPTAATWPQLAEGLYAFLTERQATIEYQFDNMSVQIPRDAGDEVPQARWKLDGTLRIRTSESGSEAA
jgi:hypothetical protein